ncbi:hypothetical protein [Sphingomonas sp. MMS24-J13]|uniref:hypothetical protein n=1 Tax=Sphingomonas sp. MMS24-J13 TaxID=3238686 RepID=UPI00384BD5A5
MSDWVWIARAVAMETHREQLIEHGGGQVVAFLAQASGELAEDELADGFRTRIVELR